ncbi:FAD dependent oxidoreductase [Geosmithia morbida]|uniref:FAD dependent oxidoreductase n=1 Tax=Geosmithia morbida TaxID=1094350 RepID=A0A9P5CYJ9_9HYPO|nr:FAD dependent oxidoreductase [Geosmithia morbida]KAF4119477.1 FAD dependent oxidoreductase [Geosmithia morbida]
MTSLSATNYEDATSASIGRSRSGYPKQDGSSVSAWLEAAQGDALLDHSSAPTLPPEADIVIIGSGLSGTLIAHHSIETWPDKKILVLEARQFCSGATGRNAGHCKPDQWRGFPKYAEKFGDEQALKILENEQQTWTQLVSYVRENDVACDLWVGDTFDVPVTKEAADAAASAMKRFMAAGGKTEHIKIINDPKAAAELTLIKDAKACYAWPASTLNPWKLTAHIMRDNLKKGLGLYTHTEAKSVVPSSGSPLVWSVQTSRGSIRCSQVVYATNAYSSAVQPSLEGLISPYPHICTNVIPLVPSHQPFPLRNSYGILTNNGFFSINPRLPRGGSILFGGANPGQAEYTDWLRPYPEKFINDNQKSFGSISKAVRELALSQLPGWEASMSEARHYEKGWSGIIAFSADSVPFVGQIPDLPGQWISAGHEGHGMARIFTAAPGLVKFMAGGSWANTGLPDVFQITPDRVSKLRGQPLEILLTRR